MIHVLSVVCLAVLLANGLRVILGVPPISYWFRSRLCPLCEGVGYLRAHTHTGDVVDVPVSAVRGPARHEREAMGYRE